MGILGRNIISTNIHTFFDYKHLKNPDFLFSTENELYDYTYNSGLELGMCIVKLNMKHFLTCDWIGQMQQPIQKHFFQQVCLFSTLISMIFLPEQTNYITIIWSIHIF